MRLKTMSSAATTATTLLNSRAFFLELKEHRRNYHNQQSIYEVQFVNRCNWVYCRVHMSHRPWVTGRLPLWIAPAQAPRLNTDTTKDQISMLVDASTGTLYRPTHVSFTKLFTCYSQVNRKENTKQCAWNFFLLVLQVRVVETKSHLFNTRTLISTH